MKATKAQLMVQVVSIDDKGHALTKLSVDFVGTINILLLRI